LETVTPDASRRAVFNSGFCKGLKGLKPVLTPWCRIFLEN
jgi:hypothetical protein